LRPFTRKPLPLAQLATSKVRKRHGKTSYLSGRRFRSDPQFGSPAAKGVSEGQLLDMGSIQVDRQQRFRLQSTPSDCRLKILVATQHEQDVFGVAHRQAFPQARRLARLRAACYRSGGSGRPVAVIWQPKRILGRRLGQGIENKTPSP